MSKDSVVAPEPNTFSGTYLEFTIITHFSIENHDFSGVILRYLCIFNRNFPLKLTFRLQFTVPNHVLGGTQINGFQLNFGYKIMNSLLKTMNSVLSKRWILYWKWWIYHPLRWFRDSKEQLVAPKSSFFRGRILIFYCRMAWFEYKHTPRSHPRQESVTLPPEQSTLTWQNHHFVRVNSLSFLQFQSNNSFPSQFAIPSSVVMAEIQPEALRPSEINHFQYKIHTFQYKIHHI